MASTLTPGPGESIAPSDRSRQRAQVDQALFLKRWLLVWVALLTVVVIVVIFFLLAINKALNSINTGLVGTTSAVVGAGGNVQDLPSQVERINGSLAGIDPALQPIPARVDAIIGALSSIEGKLRTTDGSLKDTSGMLRTILGQAGDIRGMLVDADDPPDGLGVQNIHQRVAFINGVGNTGRFGVNPQNLTVAEADARNILAGLVDTNRHLAGICRSAAVTATGPKPC